MIEAVGLERVSAIIRRDSYSADGRNLTNPSAVAANAAAAAEAAAAMMPCLT